MSSFTSYLQSGCFINWERESKKSRDKSSFTSYLHSGWFIYGSVLKSTEVEQTSYSRSGWFD
jgi:hypothetical protein